MKETEAASGNQSTTIMETEMKNKTCKVFLIILTAMFILPGCQKSSSGVDSYLKAQDKIMDQMMKDMELKEKTGSSSLAFLTGMIPHHESAIEM